MAPFESHNRTQLSGGRGEPDGDLVTFDAWEHSIRHNNVLSLGSVVDIIKHPDVPDRGLFVFDTATDELVETIHGLGTLLYGLAVDHDGRVFLAQTDARNDANGRAGTKQQGLAELENRPFLNRITSVLPGSGAPPRFYDLEPLPPEQPADGTALATPFGLRVSDDGRTIVATAAGSRDDLLSAGAAGRFNGTFTARLGGQGSQPQPAIWTEGEIQAQSGHQEFPRLKSRERLMTMRGRHVAPGAFPLVDGRRAEGLVRVDGETVVVELAAAPADGLGCAEVAAAVGVGLDAVYERLSRLHLTLRQCVEGKLIEAQGAHR